MTILNVIYQKILSECTSCKTLFDETDPDKIRLGTIQIYDVRNNLKFAASSSDFPCMEIRHTMLSESTSHSGGMVCKSTWQITLATGVFDYESRLFPKEMALLAIAQRLKRWRYSSPEDSGTHIIGAAVSPVSIGRLTREGEPDSDKGWVAQCTYDVSFSLSNEKLENFFLGE